MQGQSYNVTRVNVNCRLRKGESKEEGERRGGKKKVKQTKEIGFAPSGVQKLQLTHD